MKSMLAICGIILLLAILTYDKWSYKAWYERCIKKGTGYDIDGNYYNHNKGMVYYKDDSVEKIDYQNLNKNRRKYKMRKVKIFMGNPCGYGNCMSVECEKCSHYKPTFFGVRVPRWLGNILFRIQSIMNRSESSGRF